MKIAAIIALAVALGPAAAMAQGASSQTPGHEMQTRGVVKGTTGASGHAPGHTKKMHHSAKTKAPGHKMTRTKKTTHMRKASDGMGAPGGQAAKGSAKKNLSVPPSKSH